MMRQVAGPFMEHEMGRLVAKLRGRERRRKETGKKLAAGSHTRIGAEARRLRRVITHLCRVFADVGLVIT